MKTETRVVCLTFAAVQPHDTTGSVPSKDGTTIGYQQLGQGLRVVVLRGGSKSSAFLTTVLDTIEKVLPQANRIEFSGFDHGRSRDASASHRGGEPERVVRELRCFFAVQ